LNELNMAKNKFKAILKEDKVIEIEKRLKEDKIC
jgi:hypothetical protein